SRLASVLRSSRRRDRATTNQSAAPTAAAAVRAATGSLWASICTKNPRMPRYQVTPPHPSSEIQDFSELQGRSRPCSRSAGGPTQPVREPRREARADAAPAPVRQLEGSRPQRPVLREESSVAPVFAIARREISIHPPG